MVNLKDWILGYLNKDVGFNNIGMFISYIQEMNNTPVLKSLLDLCFADTEISIPILERVLELDPKDTQAWAWMGNMYWLDGEDEICKEKLEVARGIDPNSPDVKSLEDLLSM